LCTDVITQADSKKYKDWKIPFTEKSFIVQYDGTVKAGIKDLTKTQVSQKGETIIVRLPEVEITGIEIDNDSFEKLDESNNIFNPITVEDLNKAQKNLKEEMYQRALEKGILDMAKSNAEEVLKGMLSGANGDYDIGTANSYLKKKQKRVAIKKKRVAPLNNNLLYGSQLRFPELF
jgi:hypothetical protein